MSQIEEFSNTLQSLLATKPPGVSGSKIKKIVQLAIANVHSESVLIQKLFTHFKKTPASHKLGALYVIDAVVRAYQDEAKKAEQTINSDAPEGTFASGVYRITPLIDGVFADAFSSNPPSDQVEKIKKVLDIWERAETFPADLISSMREKYLTSAVGGSGSTTPPGPSPAQLVESTDSAATAAAAAAAASGASGSAINGSAQDTASILQALANIAKQKNESPPASNAAATVPPASLPPPPGQSAPTQEQLQLMQKLMTQAPPPSAAVTGQPWDLSRGSDRRSRSRSPQRGRDYGGYGGGNYGNNNFRSRSPYRSEEPRPQATYNVTYDKDLPPGTIRVFSRTLFIGGIPAHMSQSDLADTFRPFVNVQSMVFHREKKHAFVKMFNRQDAEMAKSRLEELNRNGAHGLRARWGVGFGPRDCCDYQTGVSVVPIDRLTDADKRWVVHAEYGGTGGKPLEPGLVIEEPDIEIGSGVSSKAMSRRMPTNSSRNGPRSTRDNDSYDYRDDRRGRDRDRGEYGDRYSQGPLPPPLSQQPPSQMPPELAALLSKMSGGGGGPPLEASQQQQGGFPYGRGAPMYGQQGAGAGYSQSYGQQPQQLYGQQPPPQNGQFNYPYSQLGNFMQQQPSPQ